ncbi:MAG TPA: hypothetical protein VIW29_12075, partial [Polyangiaceae bacterium]
MVRVLVTRLVVLALALAGLGCGGGSEPREPTPSLSETQSAQLAFRGIQRRFFEEEEARWPLLRPLLQHFLARFPEDPRSANVRLLSAWISIVEGDQSEASRLIDEARASRSPSVRDFAEVAAARLLLARQQPALALAKLAPLEGKLVDPAERLICSELRLQAALRSHRYEEALLALASYLAAAPAELGDRARVRAESVLKSLPARTLETRLAQLEAKARHTSLSAPEVWLRRMIRERLIRQAIENKDARLARRLLDSHPGLARPSESSVELLELAASASSNAELPGYFVGLALEIGDPDAERRSASVARGLADALAAALPSATSLSIVVKASDAHRVGDVLRELADAGALALVAGVTDASAEQAATWAVSGNAPVLLLRDTPDLVLSELSFLLGVSDIDQLDAIGKELERRNLARWGRVGSGGFDCRAKSERAGQARFPIREWRSQNIEALAVLGPRSCVTELVAGLREQRLAPLLALGLEGAELIGSLNGRRFALSAGSFPSLKPGDVPADFYEALGRDAGALVRASL